MAEGLSTAELGHRLGEHTRSRRDVRHDRIVSIVEAVLLSIVTLLAAWSGYSAAKWHTESRLQLSESHTLRSDANRAFQESLTFRVGDATTFNAWFGAYLLDDASGMKLAEGRFRPEYRAAFDAWLETKPFTNPNAPPGPQAMPQYRPTGAAESTRLAAAADAAYVDGEHSGETSDNYTRTTVILASVLFLVGLSTHFPLRAVRLGLITVGGILLGLAAIAIIRLPALPA
jgi:hypothetical protein